MRRHSEEPHLPDRFRISLRDSMEPHWGTVPSTKKIVSIEFDDTLYLSESSRDRLSGASTVSTIDELLGKLCLGQAIGKISKNERSRLGTACLQIWHIQEKEFPWSSSGHQSELIIQIGEEIRTWKTQSNWGDYQDEFDSLRLLLEELICNHRK